MKLVLIKEWKIIIRIDRKLSSYDVNLLLGDARKAKTKLNWEPKITFDKLVEEMVERRKDCKGSINYLSHQYSLNNAICGFTF